MLSDYGMEKLKGVLRYQIMVFENKVGNIKRLWYGKIWWATPLEYGMRK